MLLLFRSVPLCFCLLITYSSLSNVLDVLFSSLSHIYNSVYHVYRYLVLSYIVITFSKPININKKISDLLLSSLNGIAGYEVNWMSGGTYY